MKVNKTAKTNKVTVAANKAIKKAIAPIIATGKAIAHLTGKRGDILRLVETGKQGSDTYIRALQDNKGLAVTGGWCLVDNGCITAKTPREFRVQVGAYVNGKNTGAKVTLLTEKQFLAIAKKGVIRWNVDSESIDGLTVGDVNRKGCVGVRVMYGSKPYYWQMEMDSNVHNVHERGIVSQKPAKTAKPTVAAK